MSLLLQRQDEDGELASSLSSSAATGRRKDFNFLSERDQILAGSGGGGNSRAASFFHGAYNTTGVSV